MVDAKQYDLIDENLSTIQRLLSEEQGRLQREGGFSRSTAYYRAAERLCQECIVPKTSASDLMSWIGKQISAKASHNGDKRIADDNYKGINVRVVSSDNDPDFEASEKQAGNRSAFMRSKLGPIDKDEIAIIGPYPSRDSASKDQAVASIVIKRDLKWPRLEGDLPAYKSVLREKVDGWYLKIKRIA